MILRRIVPLFLIALVHLALLQFIAHDQFTVIKQPDVIAVSILKEPIPKATQFIATSSKEKVQQKKKSAPASENTHQKLNVASTPHPQPPASEATPSMQPTETPSPVETETSIQYAALTTRPPTSASYLLDVVRKEPQLEQPYFGAGEIRWHHDGRHYTMQVEAGIDILFATIRLYSLHSEGTIDESGIKPHLMTETRRNKEAMTTYFNYDSNTLSFPTIDTIIPLSPGAQDKATVLMQLASIGNADPTQFQPGKEIIMQVAEEKEAHLHQFVVLDQEIIDTKLGQLNAWHIVRPPRLGFYSSRIDIWLAPELHWLPVQVRNTETNGAITTQTIRHIITGPE